jgi:hypothetical protein
VKKLPPSIILRFLCPAVLAAASACSPGAQPVRQTGPEIGLARGGHWSVMAVHPPYLSGPLFTLVLEDHVLGGWIAGESAPAGALHVRIDDESAEGYAPLGPVALDFGANDEGSEQGASIDGLWNGRRVHFHVDATALRGNIADNAVFSSRLSPLATAERRQALHQAVQRGDEDDLVSPSARDTSCQYVLDSREPDGSFAGTSICAGMPQPTRLAIPAAALGWMTRPELLTVLTVLLSAPPVPPSELAWRGSESGPADTDWQ